MAVKMALQTGPSHSTVGGPVPGHTTPLESMLLKLLHFQIYIGTEKLRSSFEFKVA